MHRFAWESWCYDGVLVCPCLSVSDEGKNTLPQLIAKYSSPFCIPCTPPASGELRSSKRKFLGLSPLAFPFRCLPQSQTDARNSSFDSIILIKWDRDRCSRQVPEVYPLYQDKVFHSEPSSRFCFGEFRFPPAWWFRSLARLAPARPTVGLSGEYFAVWIPPKRAGRLLGKVVCFRMCGTQPFSPDPPPRSFAPWLGVRSNR